MSEATCSTLVCTCLTALNTGKCPVFFWRPGRAMFTPAGSPGCRSSTVTQLAAPATCSTSRSPRTCCACPLFPLFAPPPRMFDCALASPELLRDDDDDRTPRGGEVVCVCTMPQGLRNSASHMG